MSDAKIPPIFSCFRALVPQKNCTEHLCIFSLYRQLIPIDPYGPCSIRPVFSSFWPGETFESNRHRPRLGHLWSTRIRILADMTKPTSGFVASCGCNIDPLNLDD